MKRVLVGHRGVGKTSLLKRHAGYFPAVAHYDLDAEIEKTTGEKIGDIFSEYGEVYFRELEKRTFDQLIQSQDSFVIAVGGGFNPFNIPSDSEVIFVSRETDQNGRIFLNRPLIHKNLSPLEDSKKLYLDRHQRFIDRADIVYQMPEGMSEADSTEENFFQLKINSSAYFTLSSAKESDLNISNLELRTDRLSAYEITQIIQKDSQKNYLVSFRTDNSDLSPVTQSNIKYDWALELGDIPASLKSKIDIVSVHEGTVNDGVISLKKYSECHLKLCPVINSWDELIFGYHWQKADVEKRSFLPRSPQNEGVWNWFRVLMLSQQKVNFIRSKIEMNDQPTIYQSILTQSKKQNEWLAVLGSPIEHSFSPVTHQKFFNNLFLKIKLEVIDFQKALSFLNNLGLRYAAVTSPLKKEAGRLCGKNTEYNSLKWTHNNWIGTSTDDKGFEKLIQQIPEDLLDKTVLWGGEGVISALQKIIPNLVCYSARTGGVKLNPGNKTVDPQVVIWAAPRLEGVQFPDHWKPEYIVDLNYTSNSMGLEYASHIHSQYVSGVEMFLEQAIYQRQFWKDSV